MAIGTVLYKQRMQSWQNNFKLNSNFAPLEHDSLATGSIALSDSASSILVKINKVSGLTIPQSLANVKDLQYNLQLVFTLYSEKRGFFGRSQVGQATELEGLSLLKSQYVYMSSNIIDQEIKLIVEYLLVIREQNTEQKAAEVNVIEPEAPKFKDYKRFGIGFTVLPIFVKSATQSVQMLSGTARSLLSQKNLESFSSNGCTVDYTVKDDMKDLQLLSNLLALNCLIGQNDFLPGLVQGYLPNDFALFKVDKDLSVRRDIYAHNIKLQNMKQVEEVFSQFLRTLCISTADNQNPDQPVRATITERKLSIVAHNTWQQLGHSSIISLSKDLNGEIQTTGTIKIIDFVMHPCVSLIFKLSYRVAIKDRSGTEKQQDFILGYCNFLPYLIQKNTDILESDVSLDLNMGPGVALTGEILWDLNQSRKVGQEQTTVKLSTVLTSVESWQQRKQLTAIESSNQSRVPPVQDDFQEQKTLDNGDQVMPSSQHKVGGATKNVDSSIQDQEISQKVHESIRRNNETAKAESDRIRLLEIENQQLRKERERLITEQNLPLADAIKHTPENVEIERAKEFYLNKNLEIEQLIKQVMTMQQKGEPTSDDQQKPLNPESMESLLKFLIYIVLHKEEVPSETTQKDQAKKSLLEVLKTDDKLRNELFGQLTNTQQTSGLSMEDKQSLAKLGLINMQSQQKESIRSDVVNLQLELNDSLTRSNIVFKFVAFKTPSQSAVSFPKSLFFTFKFFQFQTIQTEAVNLHIEKELLPASQYYLVQTNKIKFTSKHPKKQDFETVLESALEQTFQITSEQHTTFANYLKDSALAIDVWDADCQKHYGTGRIQLSKLLRQGQAKKVTAQEIELFEPQLNSFVGTLQILFTNEGRQNDGNMQGKLSDRNDQQMKQLSKDKMPASAPSKSKKIYSKPLDQVETEKAFANAATDYTPFANQISEEARKKLRIQRLRQQTASTELNTQVLNDAEASDWLKTQTLKQISLVREMKKRQLLNQQ